MTELEKILMVLAERGLDRAFEVEMKKMYDLGAVHGENAGYNRGYNDGYSDGQAS